MSSPTKAIYEAIRYADDLSFVWWPKVEQVTTYEQLTKTQRTACLAITGNIRSASTVTSKAMLYLPPLDSFIIKEAASSAFRGPSRRRLVKLSLAFYLLQRMSTLLLDMVHIFIDL